MYYRNVSYKNFDDKEFIHDISNSPFHVGEVFGDIDDLLCFTSRLLIDVINDYAPVNIENIETGLVPIYELATPQGNM